jgi:hypothetical protein
MTAEIVKIDPKEFGIEDSKAADIAAQFQPMLDKMVELETSYNEVIQMPVEERETAKKARELRLKYMKIRTATLDIHKKQKAFYLAGGKFVDGWKNAQHFASMGKEEKLEEIEKYAENLEKQRIADLQKSREEQLQPYGVENVETLNLGVMPDSVWDNFLAGTITNYNAKIQAEKDAAEAEKKRLQEEEAERERIRLENERLRKEAEEREKQIEQEKAALKAIRDARTAELMPYVVFIRDFNGMLDMDEESYQKEFADIKQGAEAQWEADRQKEAEEEAKRQAEIENQRKKNIEEGKKRKEAEEKAAKLQKEIDDRKKKEEEEAAAKEAELGKGDKAKMESLIKDLNELKTKYSFKSKKHTQIQAATNELIGKIVTYIESKV